MISVLENRLFLSVTVVQGANNAWSINGTPGNESVDVQFNDNTGALMVDGVLQGYADSVSINMGDGNDTANVSHVEGTLRGLTVDMGRDKDTCQLTGRGVVLGGWGSDTITVVSGIGSVIHGGEKDDTIILKGTASNTVATGDAGNDTIDASGVTGLGDSSLIYLDGGIENDYITGSPFADQIHCGTGVDTVHGGNGDDEIWSNDGLGEGDIVLGEGGNDVFHSDPDDFVFP